jgi:hypothetical protein
MIDTHSEIAKDGLPEAVKPIEFRPPVEAAPPVWLAGMLRWIFPVAALLFIALIAIPAFLQKWLWMRQLDYQGVFWTLVSVKVGLACAAFACAFLFLWLNVRLAAKRSIAPIDPLPPHAGPPLGGAGSSRSCARPSHLRAKYSNFHGGTCRIVCRRYLHPMGHVPAIPIWGIVRIS